MRSALYYPHIEIRNESILKTALLLWDEIHVIVPFEGYKPHYREREAFRAFSVIGRCHYPSGEEKRKAHELIEDFAKRTLPDAFMYRSVGNQQEDYEVYPQKLLPETWKLLEDASLVGKPLANADYPAAEPTGLSLMGLLADCCAGDTLARVTDRSVAYAALAGLLTEKKQRRAVTKPGVRNALEAHRLAEKRDHLATVSLKVVDTRKLTLQKLINLREDEAKEGGHSIRNLRHRLADSIETQAKLLAAAKSEQDEAELRRQFQSDMQDDYASLKEALKLEATQVLGTKEIFTTVFIALASVVALHGGGVLPMPDVMSATGAAVTLGGLFATKSKFARTRQKLLLEHPTAYLYEALGGLRW